MSVRGTAAIIALICTATGALAQDWHRDVLRMLQTHSVLTRAGTAIDFRLKHLHPEMVAQMAQELSVPADTIPGLIRQSYETSAAAVKIENVGYDKSRARFGQTDQRRWGALELSLTGTFAETGRAIPPACLWVVAYSDGPNWYYEVLATPLTELLLQQAMPDLEAPMAALPPAQCAEG